MNTRAQNIIQIKILGVRSQFGYQKYITIVFNLVLSISTIAIITMSSQTNNGTYVNLYKTLCVSFPMLTSSLIFIH